MSSHTLVPVDATAAPLHRDLESDNLGSEDKSNQEIDRVSVQEPPTVPQFPEGGSKAWMVVFGCWCTSFVSMGYVNSFGVYETYYIETFLAGYSPSSVAWIGSIQTFAQFSATIIAGPVTDRYGAMILIWPCSVLLVVAMMLTSLCTQLYQFILCQGILLGIASGLIFTPALSVVGQYFFKKRPMAMAFASTGSPLGGIIYPIIMTNLLHKQGVGFSWAQRVCGFVTLFLLLIAAVTIRPTPLRRQGRFILLDAFCSPAYSLQVGALFFVILGLWTPYFYIAQYAKDHNMDPGLANYLFAVLNAGSFVGRYLGGILSNHLGQFNVITFACFACAILTFCWLSITGTAGLIVYAVLFGGMSGIIIALMMSSIAHTADHPSKIGTYIGQATFAIGFAALAGTPIAGALVDKYGGYTQCIIYSAAVMMAGAIVFTGARYVYAKDKFVA